MALLIPDKEYIYWLSEIKSKIKSAQIKAALAANSEMIALYWDLGKSIIEKQEVEKWGSSVVERLSRDLKREFPEMNGFSRTNLFAMRQFYLFYKNSPQFVQQVVGQIPWGHTYLIISRIKNIDEAIFYSQQTIENNWSRDVLAMQIETNLFARHGKSITNFDKTLPVPNSDLAKQTLKDPYRFDFLQLTKDVQEREIELNLMKHITQFLLELGKGFAFIGQQYEVKINNKNYKIDLLFYHINLRCFVVIELKAGEFKPEYTGKLNFYLSAIDDLLKNNTDNPTIGILLCKTKNRYDVEYALRDIGKPIGVSEYLFNELPDNFKSELPTIEEIENELYVTIYSSEMNK
jgi:predicted nuclease of restriction endonuclease-like (RecB) superfamily